MEAVEKKSQAEKKVDAIKAILARPEPPVSGVGDLAQRLTDIAAVIHDRQ